MLIRAVDCDISPGAKKPVHLLGMLIGGHFVISPCTTKGQVPPKGRSGSIPCLLFRAVDAGSTISKHRRVQHYEVPILYDPSSSRSSSVSLFQCKFLRNYCIASLFPSPHGSMM